MSERSFGWPSSNKADVLPERGPGDRDRHRVMWRDPGRKGPSLSQGEGPEPSPQPRKEPTLPTKVSDFPASRDLWDNKPLSLKRASLWCFITGSPTNPAEECCTLMCRNIPELLSRCIFWLSMSGVGPGIQWGWHASRGSQCYWSSDHTLSRKGLVGTTRNASPLSVWSGMLGSNKAHVPPLLGLCSRTCKPQPREAEHLRPGLCNEKPPQWEALILHD